MVNVLKILSKSSPGAGVQGTAPALHSSLGTALWGCPGHRWALRFGGYQPTCSSSGFSIVLVLLSGTWGNPTAMACIQSHKNNDTEIPLHQFIRNL